MPKCDACEQLFDRYRRSVEDYKSIVRKLHGMLGDDLRTTLLAAHVLQDLCQTAREELFHHWREVHRKPV